MHLMDDGVISSLPVVLYGLFNEAPTSCTGGICNHVTTPTRLGVSFTLFWLLGFYACGPFPKCPLARSLANSWSFCNSSLILA